VLQEQFVTVKFRENTARVAVPAPSATRQSLIHGSGEMADRTRAFDWSKTPIGPIEQWPDVLLITVNTLLASRNPMFLWWGKDLVQFYNDAYRPSIGTDKHPSALGQRGIDCWPEIWSVIGPQINAVMSTGEATWHEDQLIPILRNGKLEDVYWTYSYSPVRDASGVIRGTLVVCTDTTGRFLAEQNLRTSQERLYGLFQQAPAFFAVLRGPNHIFEMVNPLYQELVGQRSLIGKTVREAVPEAEEQGFLSLLDTVYKTGKPFIGHRTPIQLARSALSRSLEERFLDFVYQPIRESDGTISGIIVLGVDVTENKRAELALMQSEKLAAVGRLASSIAHEINNPLESVTNLLYLARETATNAETRKYLEIADRELRRVSVIANQTLRFHKQSSKPQLVTCDELIASALSVYQGRLINSHIEVERRKRATHPVLCFEGEIRQVLSNLINNAIDAMKPDGGRLLIRSREGTDWNTGRKGLILTIADTGSGMPPETRKKIFEPFFTTKEIGGTGLGLWVSHEIVDRHGGTLTVRSSQSADHHGTVFALFLPYDAVIR
jgi:PAS domain S-box-containing protein